MLNHLIRTILVKEYEGEVIDLTSVRERQAISRQKKADWIRFEKQKRYEAYQDYEEREINTFRLEYELALYESSDDFIEAKKYNLVTNS